MLTKQTNMKKLSLLLFTFLFPFVAKAHDIEVKNAQGVMIYYVWINNTTNLAVSYQGSDVNSYSNEYSGEVIIPESVVYKGHIYSVMSIGESAFGSCSGLTSVTIPNSVTSIGSSAFAGCSGLTSIEIPNSVTTIWDYAFSGCSSLTSIEIPNSLTTIWNYAFSGCTCLTSIEIPNSVISIGQAPFSRCSGLTSIIVESGNPIYDSRNDCNAIIETVTNKLVTGCMNTIIPNSVMSIDDYAFYGSSGLTSIEIPHSVTSIGNRAFFGCSGLTTVIVENEIPLQIYSDVFTNRANATLYVPYGCKAVYEAVNYWKEFKEIIEMEQEKCATPTITNNNGTLTFACETTGAVCHYEITRAGEGNSITLSSTSDYVVSVYATKAGYLDSDVATTTITIKQGDVNTDGVVSITDAVSVVNIILNNGGASAPALSEPEETGQAPK